MCIKFALLILLLSQHRAMAWEIAQIKGSAHINSSGQIFEAKEGLKLNQQDILKTGPNSRVHLKEGASEFWMGARSALRVSAIPRSNQAGVIILDQGAVRAKIAPFEAKQWKYGVPAAVAGVRGTEFFMFSEGDRQAFCTLEGNVAVSTFDNPNQEILIPAGKGLWIRPGVKPKLGDNNSFAVAQWAADTTMEDHSANMNFYSNEPPARMVFSNFTLGGWSDLISRDSRFSYLDSKRTDQSIGYLRVSPFLRWGRELGFFIRPLLLEAVADPETDLYLNPVLTDKNNTTLALAEAYVSWEREVFGIRVGLQEIEWNDGILLSRGLWSIMPTTHLAFRSILNFDDWQIDVVASKPVRPPRALDGKTPIGIYGLNATVPRESGNLFYLYRDADIDNQDSKDILGHVIHDFGYFVTRKMSAWDYSLSIGYQQSIHIHRTVGADPIVQNATQIDGKVGVDKIPSPSFHITARFLQADPLFIPGFEDNFNLGLSWLFKRSNLRQYRLEATKRISDDSSIVLEYLRSAAISQSGYKTWTAVEPNGGFLDGEFDLSFLSSFSERFKYFLGAWILFPEQIAANSQAPAVGIVVNGRYQF